MLLVVGFLPVEELRERISAVTILACAAPSSLDLTGTTQKNAVPPREIVR